MAIRVVVAGAGQRGRDWMREVRREPDYELTASVDIDEGALRQSVSEHSLRPSQCFRNLRDALEATEAEAVIIATPADHHVEACEEALEMGRAVLVEKPFTLKLEDAVRLVGLSEQRGRPLLVAQNYRYMRSFRTIRQLVRDGALGPVGMLLFQYYRVPHEMAAGLASLSHSVMWGVGVHHLDALRYILGSQVTGVCADSFTLPWGELRRGASLRVMLQMEDGARASYSATYESSGHEFFERGQEFYARLTGERATLHVFHRWLLLFERNRWPRLVRRGPRPTSEERILLRQLRSALHDASYEAESSGRDNLQTMAVVEACIRSATEGRWINPQELLHEAEKPRARAGHRP